MKPSAPHCIFLIAVCLLAGCAATSDGVNAEPPWTDVMDVMDVMDVTDVTDVKDGPPTEVPAGLDQAPDPVPTQAPKSPYGNPATYEVFGQVYSTMESAAGYEEEGVASWYGVKFHGRRTSSGETFDMFKLTAAHRSLPIPTYVRVTNLENGRQSLIRVNDRGPFHADRILDLSYGAAVKLGFADKGTVRIRIEAWEKEPEIYLQAGAFRGRAAAEELKQKLLALTGESTKVVARSADGLYRVHIGPLAGEQWAEQLKPIVAAITYATPILLRLDQQLTQD